MPKGPQQGDRFGDWYLESRATPVDGKRFWNVVNTMDDRKLVVAQTDLKNLANNTYVHGEDVPSSAEITASVVAANFKDDPFNIPAGILPDDDSEYPFVVEFTEPAATGKWLPREDLKGFYFVPSENEPDDDDDEVAGQFAVDEGCDAEPDDLGDSEPENPWASPGAADLRKSVALAMEQVAELGATIDRILKSSLSL